MVIVVGVIAVGIGVGLVRQATAFSRVQPVGAASAGLAYDPRAWVGRTLLLRGVLSSLIPSPRLYGSIAQPSDFAGLLDPGTPLPSPGLSLHALPLRWGPVDPLLSLLRRLPLIGGVAPRPQSPHWDAVAVYRVRLVRVTGAGCLLPPCYAALLLDAAPRPQPFLHPLGLHGAMTPLHWPSVAGQPSRSGAANQRAGGEDKRATHDHL